VLTTHDSFVKSPETQVQPENQIAMTTLVYHYFIDKQYNNLFQLLNNSKNTEL